MLSLFSSFSSEELCQLYVFPSTPNTDLCHSYYRITDKDVLKSFYRLKVHGGVVKTDIHCLDIIDNESEKKNHFTDKNKKPIRGLARDLMWACSFWFNSDLKKWIEAEAPTCIVLIPGNAKFIYRMAIKIAKKYNLPVVVYICDEYYFVKNPKGLLAQIKLKLFKKTVTKIMKISSHVVTICDELNYLYSSEFKIPTTTLMTGCKKKRGINKDKGQDTLRINYFGNISIHRNLSIAEVGKSIDEINEEKGTKYAIHIYTSEKNPEILKAFDGINSIHLHGFVTGDEYNRIFEESDILLHVEAFDEESVDRVKNSISTKIADSLGSGIPLFAYGPIQVASIGHLKRNQCAMCVTDKAELKKQLLILLENADVRAEIVNKAMHVADDFHNEPKNSTELRKILMAL